MNEVRQAAGIPQDLVDLKNDCLRYRYDSSNKSAPWFGMRIRAAVVEYENHECKQVQLALAQCRIGSTESVLTKYHEPQLYLFDIDSLIKFITTKSLITELAKDEDNQHFFACLCLIRLGIALKTNEAVHSIGIIEILKQWSGHDIEAGALNSQEILVGHLYGPAAWTLYNQDSGSKELPIHLWNLKIPLAISSRTNEVRLQDCLPDYDL